MFSTKQVCCQQLSEPINVWSLRIAGKKSQIASTAVVNIFLIGVSGHWHRVLGWKQTVFGLHKKGQHFVQGFNLHDSDNYSPGTDCNWHVEVLLFTDLFKNVDNDGCKPYRSKLVSCLPHGVRPSNAAAVISAPCRTRSSIILIYNIKNPRK